jgi:signal transduction histidine kinase/CheY-like chemotaxis protein
MLDAVDLPLALCALAPENSGSDAIAYVNPAFRAWLKSGADLIGKPVSTLYGEQTNRAVLRRGRTGLRAGTADSYVTTLYPSKQNPVLAEVRRKPIRIGDAAVERYLLTVRPLSAEGQAARGELLAQVATLVRELFNEFDPAQLVRTFARGTRMMTGASSVQLFAQTVDASRYGRVHDLRPAADDSASGDGFVELAARSQDCIVEEGGRRAAVAMHEPGGHRRVLVATRASEGSFSAGDAFVIGLLAQYFSVAARNVELFNELEGRRAEVLELSSIKSDLIAMLAHDFAGPLTSIGGHAELLLEEADLSEEALQSLRSIQRSADRLSGLARDTLTLSRLERNEIELKLEPVDVGALIADVAATIAIDRSIRVDLRSDKLVVRADRGLRQVFENVIGNALKYSPGGEPVDVVVRRRAGKVRVTVRDRGIGIPASDRHTIFARFQRASNARRMGIAGTGFGLYFSRIFIERLGGRITFASSPARGTSFSIDLPLGYTRNEPPQTRRVLLVDRDGDARSFTAHSLRLVNYVVRTVETLESAIETLRNDRFDVAIFDHDSIVVSLPADLRRLSAHEIRLISLGGTPEPGWDVHLTKPFMARDLQRAVEAALSVESELEPSRD